MDISGGMPAVIIKMVVESEPGTIKLLNALPASWQKGTIDGILCRGQIEIKRLRWDKDLIVVSMLSLIDQTVTLEAPAGMTNFMVKKGDATIHLGNQKYIRKVFMPRMQEITLEIKKM
jgi:hypothetical protein